MPLVGLPVEPCGRLPAGPATSASHGPGTSGQAGTLGAMPRELGAPSHPHRVGLLADTCHAGPAHVFHGPFGSSIPPGRGHQLCVPSCDRSLGSPEQSLACSNHQSPCSRRESREQFGGLIDDLEEQAQQLPHQTKALFFTTKHWHRVRLVLPKEALSIQGNNNCDEDQTSKLNRGKKRCRERS